MRISDWSSDVCSSDLPDRLGQRLGDLRLVDRDFLGHAVDEVAALDVDGQAGAVGGDARDAEILLDPLGGRFADQQIMVSADIGDDRLVHLVAAGAPRSEEHTSELQSLMRHSYAVFCLKK